MTSAALFARRKVPTANLFKLLHKQPYFCLLLQTDTYTLLFSSALPIALLSLDFTYTPLFTFHFVLPYLHNFKLSSLIQSSLSHSFIFLCNASLLFSYRIAGGFLFYLLSIFSGYASWCESLSQATCSHLVPFLP